MTYPQGKLKMWRKKMKVFNSADKKIQKTIFEKPEIVVKILRDSGVRVSNEPTLSEITSKTFTELYEKKNLDFGRRLDILLTTGEYNNAIGIAIAIGSSIVSGILGSRQARKQRELQMRIATANLENEKLLAEEQNRIYGETERTKILANSLTSFRTALQSESTARQKNVYIYLIALGLGISIIYGTNLLLSE